MKYNPHNYQKYAIDFIKEHPVSALLLDMGLGKTSITLTAINDLLFDSFEVSKVLIIAPLRVARDTWPEEIHKWSHLILLKTSLVVGTEDERIEALKSNADVFIINRENVSWLVDSYGSKLKFDMIVIDELSSFKNGRTKRFKSLMSLRPFAERVVGLTGTPASNSLMDLWAEFKVLDLGQRLGRFITHYREAYFKPDKRNGSIIYSYRLLPFAEEKIYEQISDITISMKAKDHLAMPELIVNNLDVQMSASETKLYNKLKQDLVLSLNGTDIVASNAASLSGKLVQMANGAIYNENHDVIKIHDKKLDALEDIIEASYGKPILVAYWYKHDLERIKERLIQCGIEYDEINKDASIKKWNAGLTPVGLIQPGSAGHGLNLQQGGSTIVWFGLTWSLELYEQTNARLYRQGQKDKTVVIEHIVAKGTIDEKIIKALEDKNATQEALIKAVKAEVYYES